MKKYFSSLIGNVVEQVTGSQKGPAPEARQAAEATVATSTINQLGDLQKVIYQGMRQLLPVMKVRYQGDTSQLKRDVMAAMERAIAMDDYVAGTIKEYGYSSHGYDNDMEITFTFQYNTTAEQERFVQSEVRRLVGELITPTMREVDKVQAINEWIVKNTMYSKRTKTTPHAAYTILAEGKGVCQAYAMLAYAMLRQAGMHVRYVTGYAGENHAWNMVRVDGAWYHLDVTWNDPTWKDNAAGLEDYISYQYFLLSDRAIRKTHRLDTNLKNIQPANSERFQALQQAKSAAIQMKGLRYVLTPDYTNGYLYYVDHERDDAVYRLHLHVATPTPERVAAVRAIGVAAAGQTLYFIDLARGQAVSKLDVQTKRVTPLSTPQNITRLKKEDGYIVGYQQQRAIWREALTTASTPIHTPPQAQKAQTMTRYVDAKSGAVVRDEPSTGGSSIAVLSNGTAVQVHKIETGWAAVTVAGKTGYIAENKLRS